MGGESVEVEVEAIAGEHGQAADSQGKSQVVDQGMREGLGARAQCQSRDDLGLHVDCHPQPELAALVAQPGFQFVQLDVPQVEVAEQMAMEALGVHARAGEPSVDGGFGVTEDAHGSGDVEALGQS